MKNINWTQSILSAVITIIVTVGGGMILFNLQTDKPTLNFHTEKILPFKSQKENLNIYHIKFENLGNKLAEEIVGEINLYPANIKEVNFSSDFPIDIQTENDSLKIKFSTKSLNPKESFKASILAISNVNFPDEPKVKLRGKGIIGEKINNENKNEEKDEKNELPIILLVSFASVLSLLTRGIIKNQGIGIKHSDDQNKIIAFLYGIHNLDKQAEKLLSLPNKLSYWSESDRLTSNAINSDKKEQVEKVKNVLTDLLSYAKIADSSRGIIYYNLARVEKYLGNEDKSTEYIEKSKEEIPKLLETRMKIDPIFKN
ncbi:hypothetical protein [Wenyingzhuangia sp. 2_MG-2023]|uniref:hypothetical protein n=1 Tax=Wenyingzhuangia sp. 2_MG-2023 TaxID=3062639 RepID=UPI0026E2D590|nr:hypothetical protein [Wenyingzhuangia sp. 2_MG-2023]MDO6739402.1 hypothetical protein [Wenyingzhuangia sp. 2_MG-2023]